MAESLVIIEAPGKRAGLSDVLWRAGMRGFEVLATAGHIAANPARLTPLGITSSFRETAYAIREDRQAACERIREAAQNTAGRIYLATDDDQEGDVIARDVWRMVIAPEDRARALRVRLRALSPDEVQSAFEAAAPFDPLSAAKGDARRVLDRLVGALSSAEGAVGRVQGSLLLALAQQKPVVGVATFMATADDGGGPWIAQRPVHAGEAPPEPELLDVGLPVGSSVESTVGTRPMNYGEIVLSASVETGAEIADVAKAMQTLYERGQMTYPRSSAQALSVDSARRLEVIAKMNGAAFDAERFTAVRAMGLELEHGHEAPNPAAFDIPLNRDAALLSLPEQVMVHIARNLVDCGVRCTLEQPALGSLQKLPDGLAGLPWHRKTEMGVRLYPVVVPEAGFKPWTQEQSLLHLMHKNGLGRPSTVVEHVNKFVARGLVDAEFELTAKGRDWCANVGQLFQHQNLARLVEEYLEAHREPAALMVADMVEKFGIPVGTSDGMPFDQEYEDGQENTFQAS